LSADDADGSACACAEAGVANLVPMPEVVRRKRTRNNDAPTARINRCGMATFPGRVSVTAAMIGKKRRQKNVMERFHQQRQM
jgi:hypothetical protein